MLDLSQCIVTFKSHHFPPSLSWCGGCQGKLQEALSILHSLWNVSHLRRRSVRLLLHSTAPPTPVTSWLHLEVHHFGWVSLMYVRACQNSWRHPCFHGMKFGTFIFLLPLIFCLSHFLFDRVQRHWKGSRAARSSARQASRITLYWHRDEGQLPWAEPKAWTAGRPLSLQLQSRSKRGLPWHRYPLLKNHWSANDLQCIR